MTTETLHQLLELLDSFHRIIHGENLSQYSPCVKTIECMQRNIRAALSLPFDDIELCSLLSADWQSLFPLKSGLSDFYLWHEDFAQRLRLNRDYEALREEIGLLISHMGDSSANPK